jgi:thiamine-phosphate pyrophosphorylase
MIQEAGLRASLRLVVILDWEAAAGRDLALLAGAAERGGATMLQVRAKRLGARDLAEQCRRVMAASGLPVMVNDRLDVALAVGAAGCHLGQDDLPISEARAMAPPGFTLGGSAGSEEEARRAAAQGAHYLGIGPVAASPSKLDAGEAIGVGGFARVRAAAPELPAVAIGGVTASHVASLLAAGASGLAVIAAVLHEPDPEAATRRLLTALDRGG